MTRKPSDSERPVRLPTDYRKSGDTHAIWDIYAHTSDLREFSHPAAVNINNAARLHNYNLNRVNKPLKLLINHITERSIKGFPLHVGNIGGFSIKIPTIEAKASGKKHYTRRLICKMKKIPDAVLVRVLRELGVGHSTIPAHASRRDMEERLLMEIGNPHPAARDTISIDGLQKDASGDRGLYVQDHEVATMGDGMKITPEETFVITQSGYI